MDNKPILEVKHLCKYFSSKNTQMKAVDDVNFEVFKGETFGLVGESGCGKTTTGRTIIRLYKPTSGEVWFNGNRIDGKLSKEESRAVTSKMQMIFQDPVASLNPRMTVEEIISEGAKINNIFSSKEELQTDVSFRTGSLKGGGCGTDRFIDIKTPHMHHTLFDIQFV